MEPERSAGSHQPKSFFSNPRIEAIDQGFQVAAKSKVIHHNAAGDVLDGRTFISDGKEYVNFSSCSYLGLEMDARLKNGIVDSVGRFGASFIMSRTYASSPQFAEFESLLTELLGAHPVVTSSATLAHLSFMSVFVQQNDVILLDSQVHNSVQMASLNTMERARIKLVRHNDAGKLEAAIHKYSQDDSVNNIWYMADGVYSMFGDKAPVHDLVALMNKYEQFYCYIDDSHGMSTDGKHGRGYVLGQQGQLHSKMVVVASLSKGFGMGCGGVLVLPNREWQRKVRTCGPTLIFSTPIPPPMLGAGIASAKIHLSDEIYELQGELDERIHFFKSECRRLSIPVFTDVKAPLSFIRIGDGYKALRVVERVFRDRFFVNMCGYPAVAKNHCGLRLTITRHVSKADITALAQSIRNALNHEVDQNDLENQKLTDEDLVQ